MFQSMLAHVTILIKTIYGDVSAFTYFPYQNSSCRSTTPVMIHSFTNGTVKNGILFPPKVDNMKGCVLKIVSRNPVLYK